MKKNLVQVTCPEHDQKEVVEVDATGEITWCSRVAGRPKCAGTCKPMLKPLGSSVDKPSPADT